MFGRFHAQAIPFIAAFVKADTTLRISDKIKFRLLQLKGVDVEACVDGTCIEQNYDLLPAVTGSITDANMDDSFAMPSAGGCCTARAYISYFAD